MAYDHNLRQKKNAQKAAEEVFEGKAHRDQRQQQHHASKTTWLVTLGVLVAMGVVYSVVNHFETRGLKGSERAQTMDDQPALTENGHDDTEPFDAKQTEQSPVQADTKAETAEGLTMPDTSSESFADLPPVQVPDLDEQAFEASELKPEKGFADIAPSSDVEAEGSGLTMESLPIPEAAKRQPKMTFYDEMQTLEVPLDDDKKYPLLLEVPRYIVAGSFYRESSARRELKRLSAHGQELVLVASSGKGDRVVYILKTQAYKNRRELGARKNALRDLGARVRSYPQRN